MRVLRDNLLVKELEREQLGKVILPKSIPDDPSRGEVVEVGPGDIDTAGNRIELDVKKGDIIVFPPAHPSVGRYPQVIVDGVSLIILPERLVWAVEN